MKENGQRKLVRDEPALDNAREAPTDSAAGMAMGS